MVPNDYLSILTFHLVHPDNHFVKYVLFAKGEPSLNDNFVN